MNTHAQTSLNTALIPSSFMPVRSSLLQRKCACGVSSGMTGECEECEGKKLQRKAAGNQASAPVVPHVVHETLRSQGRPLEQSTRAFMESRFGHEFSSVRVHTDARAAESAKSVDSVAYTVGPR